MRNINLFSFKFKYYYTLLYIKRNYNKKIKCYFLFFISFYLLKYSLI